MDKNLKKMLLKQMEEHSKELDDKLIAKLKNPRYTSGRLMKYGDRPVHVLETIYKNEDFEVVPPLNIKLPGHDVNPTAFLKDKKPLPVYKGGYFFETLERSSDFREISLKTILLQEEEIDEFCRNYLYLGGEATTIRVIKKPKYFIL